MSEGLYKFNIDKRFKILNCTLIKYRVACKKHQLSNKFLIKKTLNQSNLNLEIVSYSKPRLSHIVARLSNIQLKPDLIKSG